MSDVTEMVQFKMKVTMMVTGEVTIETNGKDVQVTVDVTRPLVIDPTLFTPETAVKKELEQKLMPYAMDAVLRTVSEQVRDFVRTENAEVPPQGLPPFEVKA